MPKHQRYALQTQRAVASDAARADMSQRIGPGAVICNNR